MPADEITTVRDRKRRPLYRKRLAWYGKLTIWDENPRQVSVPIGRFSVSKGRFSVPKGHFSVPWVYPSVPASLFSIASSPPMPAATCRSPAAAGPTRGGQDAGIHTADNDCHLCPPRGRSGSPGCREGHGGHAPGRRCAALGIGEACRRRVESGHSSPSQPLTVPTLDSTALAISRRLAPPSRIVRAWALRREQDFTRQLSLQNTLSLRP
jgi:hypothetical protein